MKIPQVYRNGEQLTGLDNTLTYLYRTFISCNFHYSCWMYRYVSLKMLFSPIEYFFWDLQSSIRWAIAYRLISIVSKLGMWDDIRAAQVVRYEFGDGPKTDEKLELFCIAQDRFKQLREDYLKSLKK